MQSRYLIFLILMGLISSCLDNAPRNRPTFAPSQAIATGTEEEEPQVEEFEIPSRPDEIVFMQSGHCGCLDGEPITLGTCVSFCAGKSATVPTLFADIEIDEANSDFGIDSVFKWCQQVITYEDPETGDILTAEGNPDCVVEFKDQNGVTGTFDFNEATAQGASSVQIDITNLDDDKTYRVALVETQSGARSNTIQVRKVSQPVTDPVGGPLQLEPVFQYTCMLRSFFQNEDNGQILYESNNRAHFYFIAETRPEPLPGFFPNIYCHDYQVYGETPVNNPLLEETPGHFFTWKKWDPRFYDLNENQKLEIHEILEQKIIEQSMNVSQTPEVFFELEYLNGPNITQTNDGTEPSASGENSNKVLGYYMTPFIDFNNGYKAYCPKQANYYGTNPLLVAMRDIVGVDTEAIYIGKQEGVCDYMIVPESTVKQVWFFIENGQHIEPNSDTITGKQIQFYWPADPSSPYVKKSDQRTYTIVSASELGSCGGDNGNVDENSEAANTSYPPHDKRIGCVPQL